MEELDLNTQHINTELMECQCCYLLVNNLVEYNCPHLICENCHNIMNGISNRDTCLYCNPLNLEYKIELKYNDNYIKERIGKIPKSWNLKFYQKNNNDLEIIFSNTITHTFKNYEIMSTKKLKKFMEKTVIKVKYIITDDDYDRYCNKYGNDEHCSWLYAKPLLPPLWKTKSFSIDKKVKLKSYCGIILFRGIKVQRDKVIKSIKEFYDSFNYKIY